MRKLKIEKWIRNCDSLFVYIMVYTYIIIMIIYMLQHDINMARTINNNIFIYIDDCMLKCTLDRCSKIQLEYAMPLYLYISDCAMIHLTYIFFSIPKLSTNFLFFFSCYSHTYNHTII